MNQHNTISADQCRTARRSLGLTQQKLAEAAEVNLTYIKQFETKRFNPSDDFKQRLAEFFVQQGVDLEHTPATKAAAAPEQEPASPSTLIKPVTRQCFYVSEEIPHELLNAALDRMEANDDRIEKIMAADAGEGWLSKHDEKTETALAELQAKLAENYIIFRILQGQNPVSLRDTKTPVKTLADLLSDKMRPMLEQLGVNQDVEVAA